MSVATTPLSALPVKDNIVTVPHTASMEDAFKTIFDSKVLSVPVMKDGTPVGILSNVDVAVFVVNIAKTAMDVATALGINEKDIDMNKFADLQDIPDKIMDNDEVFSSDAANFIKNFSERNPLVTMKDTSSVSALIEQLSGEQTRRVVVVDAAGQMVNYLTQSDVLKYLKANDLLGSLANKTVTEADLSPKPIITVSSEDVVVTAFRKFVLQKIPAVPVLSSDGKIVGNISAYDIRMVANTIEMVEMLFVTYPEYKLTLDKNNISTHPITVKADATVAQVVEKILENHIHRVYVVDDDGKPISVISITDVLHAINV